MYKSCGILWLTIISLLLTAETFALTCDWADGSGKLVPYIAGSPPTVSDINTADECRDQCRSQTTFLCAAVNYMQSSTQCELLVESKQTASVEEPVDGNWQHFIRPLCAGIWLPWSAEKGYHIASGKFAESTESNLDQCTSRCLMDPSGGSECRAVNMYTSSPSNNNNNCELLSARVGDEDVIVTGSSDWQYFNRPIWYLETSRSSSQAEMTYQGEIGSYLHIFTDLTLPLKGYLVAWQYYMLIDTDVNDPNIGPCKSYAAIWRQVNATGYQLISRTLLTPENPSIKGVRFQFVQNKTIRVEKGDILSLFTQDGSVGCDRSLVSVDPNPPTRNNTISVQRHVTTFGVRINVTLTHDPFRPATPSLKAYVSEYLVLSSAPTTYHNTSLTSGQIWLRLPTMTKEEHAVIAGYNIICSTDVDLTQIAHCYEGLVPANSIDVLLSLPDVTKPYYVSVQIARNFNGVELLEDERSNANNALCPARRTEEVNITETMTEDENLKVNVTLFHNFPSDDSCAEAIKLNYSGYDSGYRTIDSDLSKVFSLVLEKGATYELTMYLRLSDGTEAVFWTQQYSMHSDPTTKKPNTGAIAAVVIIPLLLIAAAVVIVILYLRGKLDSCGFMRHISNSTALQEQRPATAGFNNPSMSELPNADDSEYVNNTRIPIDILHQHIQDEKGRCPAHPFQEEFRCLKHSQLPCTDGRTPANDKKNRFKNITAFDSTRVKLPVTAQHPSDYINACYIKDGHDRVKYIASQGPTGATLVDMWRMIHHSKATVIVMVTNAVENGKEKCAPYWPEEGTKQFGEYSVELVEQTQFSCYVIRKMKYSAGDETGIVTQCQYTQWFDHDVPYTAGILSFRAKVSQQCKYSEAPAIVHCSAGVGRTGTYIALELIMQEVHEMEARQKSVDVVACVNKLRGQRMFMVQVAEQYAFLYDIVSEALSCGETSVPCAEFTERVKKWRQVDVNGGSILSEQFTKLHQTSKNITREMCSVAAEDDNLHKNRDQQSLPLNRTRVLISNPEVDRNDYINATHCDGYQQKNGFIITQIPMSSTTPDYWRMIIETDCKLVVYFNDCPDEEPCLPAEGQTVKSGKISITNIKSANLDVRANHFGTETPAVETTIECKEKSKVHKVAFLEIKIGKEKLPTSEQLVSLCQKAERYTSSGTDIIAVQCSNGCRLSGLFVVAMNLYLRTRIEHEVDIVLEVKLARLSRPQFIPDLKEFELLYSFVDYYLSEFKEYSNFTNIPRK